ncbi:MAG: single-stranded-DNA-specific exonuclease RecJ [Nitrospirae bacterium GWC2_42_7]|nr:MAG: single-stranded-DNA-specific exonuclease RecJ [Nitrospirae bacterium GWC2_42_7]
MNRRWLVNRTNQEFVNYISKSASISSTLAQVLINRGIKTAPDINYFLNPGISSLSDPFELPDMKIVVERIKAAVQCNEGIFVHGDYDADGLTATSIMVQALRKIGLNVEYFIPNRMTHGYGFNPPSVDMAKESGAKLIITVDCGITSFEAADYAKEQGIDVIITDHHEPLRRAKSKEQRAESEINQDEKFVLPKALAIVNPKISNLKSQFSDLSGAGIAFKFAQALAADNALNLSEDDALSLLDLAALGTVADVVPLTGENRVIVRNGFKRISNNPRPGINSLIKISGTAGREAKAGNLAFSVIPRINAAGRLADSTSIVKLLTTDSEYEAEEIAAWLDRLNSERQKIEGEMLQATRAKLIGKDTASAIVLASEGWHLGVIGIVAARIAEEFYRPAIIFTIDDGIAKGSARSIPSFDITAALSECSDLLLGYGGHKQAAGVRLEASKLAAFEKRLCSVFDSSTDVELMPSIRIDADVNFSEISFKMIEELARLEPFGCGNPQPVLGSKMLEVHSPHVVGNNHIKMKLRHKARNFDAIGFDMGKLFEEIDDSSVIDAAFVPSENIWNGNRYLQLILKAFRPSV